MQKQQDRTAADQKLLAAVKTKLPRASSFEIAKHLIEELSLPVARACRIAGISRRTWYRWRRIKYVTKMTQELADYCPTLILRAAKKRNLPSVYITAHIRGRLADNARKEVMRDMIVRLGLSRSMVAGIFVRDLRRVRKSPGPRSQHGTGEESRQTKSYRARLGMSNPRPEIHRWSLTVPRPAYWSV